MQLELVDFPLAVELKSVGFNWETQDAFLYDGKLFPTPDATLYLYKQNHNWREHRYSRPSLELALKWFRDVHNLDYLIDTSGRTPKSYCISIGDKEWLWADETIGKLDFPSYESAQYRLILEFCKIISKL